MTTSGLKLNHINHVVTMVKDTKRSMEFYCDFLGIKQIQSQVDNPEITWLQLPSGVMLHLIETQDAPAHPPNIHHAFEVEDFDAAKKALMIGVSVSRTPGCVTTGSSTCSSGTLTATGSSSAPLRASRGRTGLEGVSKVPSPLVGEG